MNELPSSSSVPAKLAARVAFVNAANAKANQFSIELRNAFAHFVGKKIKKIDGSLVASVATVMKPIVEKYRDSNTHIWFDANKYSFRYGMRFSGDDEQSHFRREVSIYFGEELPDDPHVLGKVHPVVDIFKTNYSAEIVHLARQQLEALEKQIETMKDMVFPFGMNDYDFNC